MPQYCCLIRSAVILSIAAVMTPAFAQFVPTETEVCPASAGIRDPEFDPSSGFVAFFDNQSSTLEVARVLRNGMVYGCRGRVVDTDMTMTLPNFPLKNGPEWGVSLRGTEIYYTKINDFGEPSLARAWYENGWQHELLGQGSNRGLALATINAADPVPALLYAKSLPDLTYTLLWRDANDPASETSFPANIGENTGSSPRWIAGQRAISTSVADEHGVYQAARYDLDTQQVEMLTFDPGDKSEVWMWSAPEFGGEPVLTAIVDGCCLNVYRQIGGDWTVIQTFDPAQFSPRPAIISPEPFVHNGRSYLVMQLSERRYSQGEIWMASIDPAAPLLVEISDPQQTGLVRTEPEWMTTSQGVFVYYSLVESRGSFSLRRLSTPLGP